ncbi:conserved membrane hypothetical protein [Burkholderia sp. 8Y]|nr:conserved membrane hypothetical protein [Burkholderia sp. 8Y]
MLLNTRSKPTAGGTHGAERGLGRFEGFSDAVFAIALTLLIVEIKVPGSPEGTHGYSDLANAMAAQWRQYLALVLCYVVIGAYWLQHRYSGRIYAKSDHWFGVINLLFLPAIVVIPYPIRIWCFHLGTGFEPVASVTLVVGLALLACAWMGKWFYAMPGRRLMDERLAPDFIQQMTRRYGMATLVQIVAVPVVIAAPRIGMAIALLCVGFFLLPQPRRATKRGRSRARPRKRISSCCASRSRNSRRRRAWPVTASQDLGSPGRRCELSGKRRRVPAGGRERRRHEQSPVTAPFHREDAAWQCSRCTGPREVSGALGVRIHCDTRARPSWLRRRGTAPWAASPRLS